MRRAALLAAPLALTVAALLAVPADAAPGPAGPPARADLPRLQAELADAAADAQRRADALEAAAARDGGLRVRLDRLAEQQEAARGAVDARARQAYLATAGRATPLHALVVGLAAPELRGLADAELARRGAAGGVRAALELAGAVDEANAAQSALLAQTAAFRAGLAEQAQAALAAQERARALLAEAEAAVAAAEAQAAAARAQARRAADAAAARAALTSVRTALDRASAGVTQALTPAQTRRSRDAATREAPVVALVEAAGSGYPAGYAPTGQVLRGVASWYGPGFVGNPTASGAPYDPERRTCAHRTLPLGTVLRVSREGRAISCLVNDRGPYVGDRIVDLSRAGSRALGFDGVAAVAVEVLAPTD